VHDRESDEEITENQSEVEMEIYQEHECHRAVIASDQVCMTIGFLQQSTHQQYLWSGQQHFVEDPFFQTAPNFTG